MAARKPKPVDPQQLQENILEEYQSGETLNPYLESVMSELGVSPDGDDATIHVSTIDEKTSIESKIWQGPVEDYDLKMLAEKFGSGAYRVKLYMRNETGQKPLRANSILYWRLSPEQDAKLKNMRDNPQGLAGVQAPAAPAFTPESLAAAIRAAMPPPPDPMQMFTQIAGIIKSIVPQQAPVASAQSDPFAMFRAAAEIMRDARGSGDDSGPRGESNANDIWLKLLDKAGPLFQMVAAGQGKNPMIAPQLTPPVDEPAPQINGESQDMNAIQVAMLKRGLAFLNAQAEGGHDPQLYADVVMDQVPEKVLRELIAMPDPVTHLQQIQPLIAKNREWFVTLFQELTVILNAPPGDEEPPEEPPAA